VCGSFRAERNVLNACPLNQSPLATLRRRHRLTLDEVAEKLGLSVLQVCRLEARTQRIPVKTLRHFADRLKPTDDPRQLSMFDLEEEGCGDE